MAFLLDLHDMERVDFSAIYHAFEMKINSSFAGIERELQSIWSAESRHSSEVQVRHGSSAIDVDMKDSFARFFINHLSKF